jgi:UDP-glucose 4-epimerase
VTASLSWVVGRGGLLGRHVESALAAADARAEIWRPSNPIPWHDIQEAGMRLDLEAGRFFERATRSRAPWRLLWCAGTSGVPTSPEVLSLETLLLSRLLDAVTRRVSDDAVLASAGTLFFASSAGGVYAGGVPPFDEFSPERPLAPYGREKLLQEELVTELAATRRVDLLIGRFSNLYGPGQKLSKPQGLVAHVGRAALRREPVSIWVPLDTIRDYLFAADTGRMTVAAIERREAARRRGEHATATTKIFASEVETTVASVLATWRQALRRPLRVALGSSAAGNLQPRVLSFRSCVWPDLRGQPTLLPLGVAALQRDQLARMQASGLG